MFSALKKYKEIIIVQDYTFSGGGARPIYTYYRNQVNKGHEDVLMLRLIEKRSVIKLLLLLFFKNRFIVNGIAPFYSWITYVICFLKNSVIIYLHEAGPHVDAFKQSHSVKGWLFEKLLQRKKVAFVSEWQQQYFQEHYQLGKTKILYNAMFMPRLQTNDTVNICMIAYQTRNKNVDFFSRVADHAAQKGLPYKFYWIGGDGGESKSLYHSEHVTWLGDQDQILDLLNHFQVLLFTSQSDTFGLVLMEAVYKGKYIVTYKENGLAQYLKNLQGCRVFNEFDEERVLNDIASVLHDKVDIQANRELADRLCNVEYLEKRLNDFFTEAG